MICIFVFSCLAGLSLGLEVHQSHSDLIKTTGDKVHIFCTHQKTDYRQILWYQRRPTDTAMKLIGYLYFKDPTMEDEYEKDFGISGNLGGDTAKNGSLTIQTVKQNHTAVYYCAAREATGGHDREAYFGQGTKLTVLDETPVTPPTVKILQPSEKECKDKTGKKKKTLVCVASGFYPDHVGVSWTRNDLKITDGVSTDAAAKRGKDNYYKITSRLTIPINDWLKPNIEFKCIVSFYNGTANIERDDVFKTKGVDNPGMTRANYLKITQNAKLSYSALIVKSLLYAALVGLLVWKLQGKRGKQTK